MKKITLGKNLRWRPHQFNKTRIFRRSMLITDLFKEKLVYVYNGSKRIRYTVDIEHVGKKFGEFAFTKTIGFTLHFRGTTKRIKMVGKVKITRRN